MFVDQVEVQAGKGGGGRVVGASSSCRLADQMEVTAQPGGSIILRADKGLRTLMGFFANNGTLKRQLGVTAKVNRMKVAPVEDRRIAAPAGTTVVTTILVEVPGDLTVPGQELVVVKGGRGGRGNIHCLA